MFLHTKKIFTPIHKLAIDILCNIVPIDIVKCNKSLFNKKCKEGCKNYNHKYCCPPFAPYFFHITKNYQFLITVLIKIDLAQLANFHYREYHKMRIGNAVIKPRIEKIMRYLELKYKGRFLSTGACRLCKPCRHNMGLPCQNPKKMRYSLEAVGVDCNHLSTQTFNLPLLWYKNKQAPDYTSVICALPIKKQINQKELASYLHEYIEIIE